MCCNLKHMPTCTEKCLLFFFYFFFIHIKNSWWLAKLKIFCGLLMDFLNWFFFLDHQKFHKNNLRKSQLTEQPPILTEWHTAPIKLLHDRYWTKILPTAIISSLMFYSSWPLGIDDFWKGEGDWHLATGQELYEDCAPRRSSCCRLTAAHCRDDKKAG